MSLSSVNFRSNKPVTDENRVRNPKVSSFGGTVAALAAGGFVHQVTPQPFSNMIFSKMSKSGTYSKEEGDAIIKAVRQMYSDTGLKEKGARLRFLSPNIRKVKKKSTGKPLDKMLREIFDIIQVNTVKRGENAFFVPKDIKLPKITWSEMEKLSAPEYKEQLAQKFKEKAVYIKGNTVLLSSQKNQGSGFHELGHAMNFNLSKVGKFLQKCRPIAMFAPIVLGLYCSFTKKSKPKYEGGELNKRQKVNNFIRNNAVALTAGASALTLTEEAMATIKGQKVANKLLKPELAKKVLKSNLIAYSSYILLALSGILAVKAAVKIKDSAIENKEQKILEKRNLVQSA